MKHLFTFRQRPNESLTHRALNGGSTVVDTTVSMRSHSTVHRALCIVNLLIALSFGFSQQAWGATWSFSGGKLYFDNSVSKWNDSYFYLFIGKSDYCSVYKMSKEGSTDYYSVDLPTSGWSDAAYMAIGTSSAGDWSGGGWDYSSKTGSLVHYSAKYTSGWSGNKDQLFTPSSTSSNCTLSKSDAPNFNLQMQLKGVLKDSKIMVYSGTPSGWNNNKWYVYDSNKQQLSTSKSVGTNGYYEVDSHRCAPQINPINSTGTFYFTHSTDWITPKISTGLEAGAWYEGTDDGASKLKSGSKATLSTTTASVTPGNSFNISATITSGSYSYKSAANTSIHMEYYIETETDVFTNVGTGSTISSSSSTTSVSTTGLSVGTYTVYGVLTDGDVFVKATNTCSLTISNPEYTGLSISDNGCTMSSASTLSDDHVEQGSSVTINKGTPATGYEFDSYSCTSGSITDDDFTPTANNASVTVNWKGKTTTVTLDDQGGTDGSNSVTATYGSAMPSASKPTRTGYTFGGYYDQTGGDGTQYYNATPASTHNWDKDVAEATLYAKWTAKTTTITLDNQGADAGKGGTTQITGTYDQPLPTIVPPQKTGFNFVGYYNNSTTKYINADGTSAKNWNSASGTFTLIAHWEDAATYSLSVNKGTGIASATGSKTDQLSLPFDGEISATAETGYHFVNWTASPAANATFVDAEASNTTVTVNNGSVTVTANGAPNTNTPYTVKHYKQNLAGTGYDLAETDNPTGTTDAQVTPAVKSYEGFTAPGTQTVTINGDGTTEVTYNYTRNSYTLTWAGLTGATVTGGTPVGSTKYGTALTAPTVEKNGYDFTGWTPTVPATMPAANSTYTAQWSAQTHSITYVDANHVATITNQATEGLTDAHVSFKAVRNAGFRSMVVTIKDANNNPITPSISSDVYTFTMPTTNVTVTITATELPKVYVLKTKGAKSSLNFTDPGNSYIWAWSTADGTPNFFSGAEWSSWPSVSEKATTYEDQLGNVWYVITPDATQASNFNMTTGYRFKLSANSKTIYDDEADHYVDDVNKTSKSTTNKGNVWVVPRGNSSDHTARLYTSYPDKIQTYTVTYNANKATSGTAPTDVNSPYEVGTTVTVLDNTGNLARTGYNFSGWNENSGGTGIDHAVNSTFTISNNMTLYAKWVEKKWTVTVAQVGEGTVTPTVGEHTDIGEVTGTALSATPAKFYYFVNWTKTAGEGSFAKAAATASNNFKPTSDATIQANFAQYASTLSFDKANYFIGQNITVTPALDNHYPSTFTLCYELWLDGEKAATQPDFEINATTGVATFIAPTTTGTTYTVKAFIHDGGDCNAAVIDEFMSSTFTVAAIPTPTVNYTQTRAFGESTGMALFETNKFYDDETVTLTLNATNTPAAGATARYKFGTADASTTNTYDVTAANLDPITVNYEVYFVTDNAESEHASGTITLQPVATPKLYLTSDLTNNEVEVENAGQVTIMYRTEYYTGSATITKDDASWQTPSGQQANYMENYGQTVKQYLYIATTAVTNGRTFADTLAINVYKTVKIKVQDTNNWATNVYMWNSKTGDIKSAWPGDGFIGKIGNWHVFYVKYPNYDNFVISDGSNAGTDGHKQTVDVTVPQENTCYAIAGSPISVEGDDKGKYACNTTTCGAGLYVGDIETQNVYTGDGKLVTPVVEMEPEYRDEDLTITFTYGTGGIVTAMQQGRNILLTGNATGSTTVTATYSINGDQVQKTFTVNVTGKIMIQVKIPTYIDWLAHDNIYINFWNSGSEPKDGTYAHMIFKDWVDNCDRYYYEVPLDSKGKVCFRVGYPNGESWDETFRHTVYVNDVTKSGCYTIGLDDGTYGRDITRDGDYCWAEYQVEINMGDGTTTYHSNTVTNTNDMISFFAPGVSETGYKAGLVRIMKNGMTLATVPGTTFDSSYVYVAKIDAANKTLTDVAAYKGDYYIRTDAVNPNNKTDAWDITKQVADRTLTYFTPFEGAKYDYYWVKNVQQNDGINVQGCVANTYNKDLANKIVASDYTDGDGKVNGNDVSVRFGYNPNTNYFERAVIKGSAQNDFLNVVGNNAYNDADCTQELNESNYDSHKEYSKFSDVSDWVYEKYVYVKVDATHPGSSIVLKSKAYNGIIMYQLGYTTNPMTGKPTSTPATKTILGSSTTNGLYRLDMIYDFKTNRLISAWAPETGTIDKLNIDADVLFLRHENRDAAQITLKNDDSQVTSLESVIFVMELRKDTLPDKTGHYWFTLPFDCDINTIFGVEGYLDIWGIQRYNGEKRSHGWFKEDDATFWTWMDKNETLKAGEGYVLHFDKKNAAWKTIDDRSILRLYFPSKTKEFKMTKTAADMTMTYEDHTCTVKGREAIDSNWRLLGSFSYNNISMNSWTDQPTEEHEYSGDAAHFLYKIHDDWTKEDNAYGKYELLEAGPGTGFTYHAFFCYMTQFSGTVNWAQFTRTESEAQAQKQGLAPRRATNENEITSAHLRLNMTKGDLQQDYTYIYLEDGATAGFDNNRDLVKIRNDKFVQLYTMTEVDPLAGNVLPVEDQIIPVAVNLTTAGTYTFAMPDGTDGAEVYLVDSETGKHTDMSISSYTVDLQKGRVEDRFYLDIKATKRTTPTVIDLVDGDGNVTGDQLMKFIRNDHMYIMRDGKLYDGAGTSVK